jgi:hypothetical protein
VDGTSGARLSQPMEPVPFKLPPRCVDLRDMSTVHLPARERLQPDVALRLRGSLALASASAALIHVMAASHHFAEWRLFGTGFVVMAVLQGASAVTFERTAWRRAPLAAVLVNAPIVLLWVWSRTLGLPFGPGAGEPEAVGIADALCSVTELVIIGGALALQRGASERWLARWSTAAVVVALVGAVSGFGHLGH